MSVRITYFVHGTTEDNEARRASGWNETPLSAEGRKRVALLDELSGHLQFDHIFSSDLGRAVETVKIAWNDKFPHTADSRLRECNYGDYNGAPQDVAEPVQEMSIYEQMPNGESYEMVKERIASFLADLKRDYDGKHVGIVGHKAPQLALEVLLNGKTWEEAFATDWRKTKAWQPGWEYTVK